MNKPKSYLKSLALLSSCALVLTAFPRQGMAAQDNYTDDRISRLEMQLERLAEELRRKEQSIAALEQRIERLNAAQGKPDSGSIGEEQIKTMIEETVAAREQQSPLARLSLGGYGEIHANISEGSTAGQSKDQLDIHRLVTFLGYEFNDWIRFQSEVEIEHAMVSSGDGGELEIEQAHLDFLLNDSFNIRAGRFLIPVGIVNQHHEPTTFNGVERPNFAKYIVPSTWWSDGVGLFGNINDSIKYEAYLAAGLDGSGFDDIDGIRGGRLKERPSLNELAITARLDYFPWQASLAADRKLRLGASIYHGGINNGNKGADPGVSGDLTIYSADFDASAGKFDFRGVYAFEKIDGAQSIGNNVAEEIMGYYLEGAYHFWPDSWKTGKLKNSDALVFVRYDDYDTQYSMPAGVQANPAGDRHDWTFGISFFPTHNVVVKADYQIREAEGANDPDNTFNLGIGWQF